LYVAIAILPTDGSRVSVRATPAPPAHGRLRSLRAGIPLASAVPLVIDGEGLVHAATTSRATVLARRSPRWEVFVSTARRWMDEHCDA
jgi:hypothetical protein